MNLLPYQNSILVLPLVAQEVERKLRRRTKPLPNDYYQPILTNESFIFNGWVKENTFRISRRIGHAENFLPLIVGKIEPTSKGSILFIRFQMFPGIMFFMGFFCALVLAASLFFLLAQKNWINFIMLLLISAGIYLISVLDFNQKVKISKRLLEKVLTE